MKKTLLLLTSVAAVAVLAQTLTPYGIVAPATQLVLPAPGSLTKAAPPMPGLWSSQNTNVSIPKNYLGLRVIHNPADGKDYVDDTGLNLPVLLANTPPNPPLQKPAVPAKPAHTYTTPAWLKR